MNDRLTEMGELQHVDQTKVASISAIADRALECAPNYFYLIGFSFGGFVDREICLKAPKHVLRLNLINTSARGDDTASRSR
jgi:pimeloyl-ACP methyl ester carboxylesterase